MVIAHSEEKTWMQWDIEKPFHQKYLYFNPWNTSKANSMNKTTNKQQQQQKQCKTIRMMKEMTNDDCKDF